MEEQKLGATFGISMPNNSCSKVLFGHSHVWLDLNLFELFRFKY